MKWTNRLGRWMVAGGAWTATALVLGAAGAGCLSRPVGQQPPTTKVNFTSKVSQQAVDKIDLLFAIDNSASMGDKQLILAEAVPNLLEGLLRPLCVDEKGNPEPGRTRAEPTGEAPAYGCPQGSKPEFAPITDMHIGIVSSSLGSLGGDICPADEPNKENDDRGRLVNRSKDDPSKGVAAAAPSDFLAWFPQSKQNEDTKRHPPPANPIRTIEELSAAFTEMIEGNGERGCGFEAQLESVYRFLIQPDPWETISVDEHGQARLDGIDVGLLKQRAEFLRPDSLVAVIMLTDEDDSSADPLALGGQGWAFMSKRFPGSNIFRPNSLNGTTAPRATSACAENPGSEDCTSCGFQTTSKGGCDPSKPECQKINNDPNCKASGKPGEDGDGFRGYYASDDDELNVRFHDMKRRYGIDPQYPIERYVHGFTRTKVPNREAEHVTPESNGGPRQIAPYTSTGACTNPLFAAKLPTEPGEDLCNLPVGTRTPDLVFFAVVGGVPNQLLHFDPNDPEASRITEEDWVKILGRNPAAYDLTGIDPHMIQSVEPRTKHGLGGADAEMGSNGDDPIHGREWNTEKQDLQFACTFALPERLQKTCVDGDNSCDCAPNTVGNPPLCGPNNLQVKAKAYPTIREFQVVRELGDQGVVASLCPIQLDDPEAPDYGYKPAVAAIIDRLKNALTVQCLPQQLTPTEEGVPCLVLAQLSPETDTGGGCGSLGLEEPSADILDVFQQQQRAESGNVGEGGVDLSARTVCVVPQEVVARGESCEDLPDQMRWCYVENDPEANRNPAGRCPQALLFSEATKKLAGTIFSLQCINQFAAGEAAGE